MVDNISDSLYISVKPDRRGSRQGVSIDDDYSSQQSESVYDNFKIAWRQTWSSINAQSLIDCDKLNNVRRHDLIQLKNSENIPTDNRRF